MKLILLALLIAVSLSAQTTHTATLTWTASTSVPPQGTSLSYNVYGSSAVCPATQPTTLPVAGFTKLTTTPVTSTTYQATGLAALSLNCFFATTFVTIPSTPAVTLESVPSNIAAANVPPDPPKITIIIIQ